MEKKKKKKLIYKSKQIKQEDCWELIRRENVRHTQMSTLSRSFSSEKLQQKPSPSSVAPSLSSKTSKYVDTLCLSLSHISSSNFDTKLYAESNWNKAHTIRHKGIGINNTLLVFDPTDHFKVSFWKKA